jgi:spectinomycin phosphotransferase
VSEDVIRAAIRHYWSLSVDELIYIPQGGGAYHWTVSTSHDQRWFVTCDDLDTKPWLGGGRDAVFAGLVSSYQTAIDLGASGSEFVVAPIVTLTGDAAARIDDRHSLSIFPYVEGTSGAWGRSVGPRALDDVVDLLARLHETTPPARLTARHRIEVPRRRELDAALSDLGSRWDAGPLSESARRELSTHRDLIVGWLSVLDQLTPVHGDRMRVVTHGEPHPGNLIGTRDGLALIDWDTVALAPRERDLWMLQGHSAALGGYCVRTGAQLDSDVLEVYRNLWALTDIAAFTHQLRSGHRRDADTERALSGLRSVLERHEPAPYG